MHSVILLDPRGILDSSNFETVRRHERYLLKLRELIDDSELIVISGNRDPQDAVVSQVRFVHTGQKGRLNFRFIATAQKIAANSGSERMLIVAGDPWETLIQAYAIKKLIEFRKGVCVRIQAQIHADVTSSHWKELNRINFLRFKVLRLSLKLADSVRVTSESRKRELISAGLCSAEKIVVSSVPLNLPFIPNRELRKRPRSVGFIGRLHPDRGLDVWIQTVLDIAKLDSLISFNIAGDGPIRDEFLARLQGAGICNPVSYRGFLIGDKIVDFWQDTGVLLSTAPSESFGRSITESLVYGVPVWCVHSSGVIDLQESYGENWVRILDSEATPESKMEVLEELLQVEIPVDVREKISNSQGKSIAALAESWAVGLSESQVG